MVGVNSIPELELWLNFKSISGIGIRIGIEIGGIIENGIATKLLKLEWELELTTIWMELNFYNFRRSIYSLTNYSQKLK